MSATLTEEPATSRAGTSSIPNATLEIRNGTKGWLLEGIIYIVGLALCCYVGSGAFYFAVLDLDFQTPFDVTELKVRVVSILTGVVSVLLAYAAINSAMRRVAFYQDEEPKLTLTTDSFCDHRDGTTVELANIEAIRFDNRYHKSNEVRADFHVTLINGADCVFNLLRLDMPSKEITWRLAERLGMTDAEGIQNPVAEPETWHISVLIFVAIVILLTARALSEVY